PPEHFEKTKSGDCDDFALWTWRQLLSMGYDARFVVGRHGHPGPGHAWVTFLKEGKHYLVEPLFQYVGDTFPRLSTIFYHPKFSVVGGRKSSLLLSPRILKRNEALAAACTCNRLDRRLGL